MAAVHLKVHLRKKRLQFIILLKFHLARSRPRHCRIRTNARFKFNPRSSARWAVRTAVWMQLTLFEAGAALGLAPRHCHSDSRLALEDSYAVADEITHRLSPNV